VRIWSLHPQYLDRQGLLALWRETLLAQAVLRGETRGYRNHPQLERFKAHARPVQAIASYLRAVHAEAGARGYRFDATKISQDDEDLTPIRLIVHSGQLDYEWQHLLRKLQARSPELGARWAATPAPRVHPMFELRPGPVEAWERA
jgi:hypothetical protein